MRDGQKDISILNHKLGSSAARLATPMEINQAIEALTTPDLIRLKRFATFRLNGLGSKGGGRSDQDLINDALSATLAGERKWHPDVVTFVRHLLGVMRSMTSHWAQAKESLNFGASHVDESIAEAEGADALRQLSARQELARIEAFFADDVIITRLLAAMASGLSGPEIKDTLDISQRDLETAFKRLRRGAWRLATLEEC